MEKLKWKIFGGYLLVENTAVISGKTREQNTCKSDLNRNVFWEFAHCILHCKVGWCVTTLKTQKNKKLKK